LPELHVTKLTSIGAVPRGDNPAATIMLWKRHPQDSPTGATGETRKDPTMADSPLDALDLSPEDREVVDAAMSKAAEEAAAAAVAKSDDEPEPDPLAKAAPEVQAMFAKQAEALAETRDELAKEIATRRTAEYGELAKSLASVVGDSDVAAAHLDALQKGAPDAFVWLRKQLEQAANVAETSDLFKRIGGVGDAIDVDAQVAKKVEELRKANPALSPIEAKMQVWEMNPDLVAAAREGK
jgi:hypothetical protein